MPEVLYETGPWIAAALLCRDVNQQPGGAIRDVIGIFQEIVIEIGDEIPAREPAKLVLSLLRGQTVGTQQIIIDAELPNGDHQAVGTLDLVFDPEVIGNDIVADIAIPTSQAGIIWFGILLNDRLITRIAVRIVHQVGESNVPMN